MKNQAEEDLLVMAAQKGSQDAFSMLFQRYQPCLLRFAFKICNDHEVAKEATQDVWIKNSKNISRLKDPRAFKSWMYRAVRWRVIDLVRSIAMRDNALACDKALYELESTADENSKMDIGVDNQLAKAIEALPAIEKQMIHLFYLDDMSVCEVSVVLEIPSGTVKSRLNRARQLLKQKLENSEYEY